MQEIINNKQKELEVLVHKYEKALYDQDQAIQNKHAYDLMAIPNAEKALTDYLLKESKEFHKRLQALCEEFHGAEIVYDMYNGVFVYFGDVEAHNYNPSFKFCDNKGRAAYHSLPMYDCIEPKKIG